MDKLDIETIEKVQDHDQSSIMGCEDKIVSIPDTELVQQIPYAKV